MAAHIETGDQTTHARPPIARGRLLALVATGAALLVVPFFALGPPTAGSAILAVFLVLPHALTAARLLRRPEAREGPGLALGIGLSLCVIGVFLCAVAIHQLSTALPGTREPELLRLAYALVLVVSQALTVTFGAIAFRRGVSKKPAWRVLARSIVDPVAYYGLMTLIMIGTFGRH
jgi:hypothetical protein